MSSKTTTQKLARALQRLAEDELGVRPKLQGCHNIVRNDAAGAGEGPIEVRAARLFERNREWLKASGEKRGTMVTGGASPGEGNAS